MFNKSLPIEPTFLNEFINGSFNDDFNISNYVRLWIRMVVYNELEEALKEPVVAYFEVLSWHMPGGTNENHVKSRTR
jgi:hypothetical protein